MNLQQRLIVEADGYINSSESGQFSLQLRENVIDKEKNGLPVKLSEKETVDNEPIKDKHIKHEDP